MIVLEATGAPELPAWSLRRGPAAGVAVVVVVLLAWLLAVTRREGPAPTPAERAGAVLRAAAGAVLRAGPLAPGQLRHLTVHEVTVDVVTGPAGELSLEPDRTVSEQWIPADLRDEWRWRVHQETGAAPVLLSDLRGRCGSFYPEPGADPCAGAGTWQLPAPAFLATLPREPAAMLARLRADAAVQEPDADQGAWEYATAALESGILPPPVAAVVFRGLADLPGVVVTREQAGDGPVTVARGAAGTRFSVTIEPRTGTLLGHERRRTTTRDGVPAGTLLDTTRVESEIVPAGADKA